MNWRRRSCDGTIWSISDFIYPYSKHEPDTEKDKGWEITAYLECTEEVADEAFERMSDAICGVEHHRLDPCPGPLHVMGMHPAEIPEGAE